MRRFPNPNKTFVCPLPSLSSNPSSFLPLPHHAPTPHLPPSTLMVGDGWFSLVYSVKSVRKIIIFPYVGSVVKINAQTHLWEKSD